MRHLLAVAALAGLLLAACGGDDGPGTVGLYDRAPVPAVPNRTQPIDPVLTTIVADGPYWAELVGYGTSNEPFLTFRLSQAMFAATCIEQLGADGCPNDYGIINDPNGLLDVPLTDLTSVTVVAQSQQNFAVTAAELFALSSGTPPAVGAPSGYQFVEFPFLLTARGGKVVHANQIWVP